MKTIKFSRSVMYTGTFLFLFTLVLIGCKDSVKPKTVPIVSTDEITNTTASSTTVSGEIVDDGNVTVTERGVVIGLTTDPTIEDTKVTSGVGEGTFSVDFSGLTANTTYHARAFGTNAVGTSYGLDKSFTTSAATLPTVTTTSITEITAFSSQSGGNVTSDGGSAITARGVCWSVNTNPTISDNFTVDGSGDGSFISSISNLNYNQTYYVRAYATNALGTAYGSEFSFSTPTSPASPIPLNGLLGWWPFNGNANDESGNGNDGVGANLTIDTDRFGNSNSSYKFNGTNSYVNIPNSNFAAFETNSYSASIWFKTNATTLGNLIRYDEGGSSAFWGIRIGYTNNVSSPGVLQIIEASNNRNPTYVNSSNGYNDNNWHLATLVRDISQMQLKLFVDGELVATNNITDINNISVGAPLYFGVLNGGGIELFDGNLDDIAIYNRALTPEEILKIYNGTGF